MSQANGLRVSGEPMEAPSLAEALLCRFLRRPKQPLNNTPLTWLKARLIADSLIKAYQTSFCGAAHARARATPRRDGRPHCREADVSMARRRPRRRAPRHACSASARYAGGTPADAQAAKETELRTEAAGHRQAGLLRLGFPATAPHLSS